MSVIEKIAAAIMASEYSSEDYPYASAEEGEKNEYRRMARAALAALREPSDAMLDRGPGDPYMDKEVWARMIDAALIGR